MNMPLADDVDEVIGALPKKEQVLVQRLRSIIIDTEPRLLEKLSFGAPFYRRNRMVCFIWPQSCPYGPKDALVSLGFCYGHMLSNEQGLLLHEGRTQVYIIKYSSLNEIDEDFVRANVLEAMLVDELKLSDIKKQRKRK